MYVQCLLVCTVGGMIYSHALSTRIMSSVLPDPDSHLVHTYHGLLRNAYESFRYRVDVNSMPWIKRENNENVRAVITQDLLSSICSLPDEQLTNSIALLLRSEFLDDQDASLPILVFKYGSALRKGLLAECHSSEATVIARAKKWLFWIGDPSGGDGSGQQWLYPLMECSSASLLDAVDQTIFLLQDIGDVVVDRQMYADITGKRSMVFLKICSDALAPRQHARAYVLYFEFDSGWRLVRYYLSWQS